jgi:hypothetical protein
MSHHWLACRLALGVWSFTLGTLAAAEPPAWTIQKDKSLVTVSWGPQPVLQYRHGDAPFKPYIKELFTPGGVQILRDSPADHVHHRGVMYGIFVNGVDYWSETPQCGRQLSQQFDTAAVPGDGGRHDCRLSQRLEWRPPSAPQPQLVERRTLVLHRAADVRATLLTWHTELQPGEGAGTLKLTGNHYDGLGLRFVQSMDQVGQFQYASDTPGPIVRGTERVTPAKWAAYTAPADGKTVTVAIFDGPQNPRSPAGLFTMLQPFSYLSATPNIWKEPLELAPGKSLGWSYGVAVWDGEISRDQIDALYQRWSSFAAQEKTR